MKEESSALRGPSFVPWARAEPRLALPPHCSLPYSWVTITLAPICLYLSAYPVSRIPAGLESCEQVSMFHRHQYHVLQVHEHTRTCVHRVPGLKQSMGSSSVIPANTASVTWRVPKLKVSISPLRRNHSSSGQCMTVCILVVSPQLSHCTYGETEAQRRKTVHPALKQWGLW